MDGLHDLYAVHQLADHYNLHTLAVEDMLYAPQRPKVDLYGPEHRSLQDKFDTRRLADNVERRVVEDIINEFHRDFIEARDMFWLASVDHRGRPTVSYKGGDPGFVRVLDEKTLAFPCYDGNGMFYSMGNIAGNAQVGLLFTDFERPYRLRIQGCASIDENDPLLAEIFEAQMIVRVAVDEVFRNQPMHFPCWVLTVHPLEQANAAKVVIEDPQVMGVFKRQSEAFELLKDLRKQGLTVAIQENDDGKWAVQVSRKELQEKNAAKGSEQ